MVEKIGRTLEELYDTYIKDFTKFVQLTNGVIYMENCDGQLKMIFIEDFDELSDYLDYLIHHIEETSNSLHIIIGN
jgi:hypothetical protein